MNGSNLQHKGKKKIIFSVELQTQKAHKYCRVNTDCDVLCLTCTQLLYKSQSLHCIYFNLDELGLSPSMIDLF